MFPINVDTDYLRNEKSRIKGVGRPYIRGKKNTFYIRGQSKRTEYLGDRPVCLLGRMREMDWLREEKANEYLLKQKRIHPY